MSTNVQASTSTPNFQPIFDEALKQYKKKTGKDLTTHPLAEEINRCGSPDDILAVLQGKANALNQSQSVDQRLTKWLTPTVNVLNALSATVGQGLGMVFPPIQIICSGISILLVAARDTAASRDTLIELFERIESFFIRLQTYTEGPPTAAMTNVMGKIMAEVLSMLAILTKEMKPRRTKTFLKKLIGRNDVEDALQRLEKLEQEELRTVNTHVFKTTSDIKDVASVLKETTSDIKETTNNIKATTSDIKATTSDIRETTSDIKETTSDIKGYAEGTSIMVQKIVSSHKWKELNRWLIPPDPSTNHNAACSSQHEKTPEWVFSEDVYKEWDSSGSLLWIHGKAGSGKTILCSSIIQHVITLRDAGSASVAYFYFDFRDLGKKHRRDLLSSLLIQLSSRSVPCFDILSSLHSTYNDGNEQPSERALEQCLNNMLMAPAQSRLPTYIILDALDECPNTFGIPTPRGNVLTFVKDLVGLDLPNLRICVTSRPEADIWTALGPLTSRHLSLHDQAGQKEAILAYVSHVVQSDPQMQRWREKDRKLVIQTLSEKADGMFRWVFCQLEMLRHCLAPSLRRQLNELPKSLDETYDRVLKEIESTNQGRHARRLLQCLVVAMRPLRVEELAEVLAFDFDAAEGEVPGFNNEWRWADQEQAVLSTCSSLISIVGDDNSRVIQFSHFSVKEYLTSDRLASASGDVSRYHIVPEPAHLILAQACLSVLLSLDDPIYVDKDQGFYNPQVIDEKCDKDILLLTYAAVNWTSHAQVGNVSSCLKNAMETLFDADKPYFLAWRLICKRGPFIPSLEYIQDSHLYWAARYGFYDLVLHVINKHPEQVYYNDVGRYSPLVAALAYGAHISVAELLIENGARAHVWGDPPLCSAIEICQLNDGRVRAVQFLLKRGAHVNAGDNSLQTPLHCAAKVGCLKVARILLEHGADVSLRNIKGQVPLHLVSNSKWGVEEEVDRLTLAQLLLAARYAPPDVNIQDIEGTTPLHFASYHRRPEIAQLLIGHGANVHAVNFQHRNSLHELSRLFLHDLPGGAWNGKDLENAQSVVKLLLEHGVDVDVLDKDHMTPLHLTSSSGTLEIAQLLLDHGAKANVENVHGQTLLHLVSQSDYFGYENANVAQLLLELGVDVNARDEHQATPLHFACSHGNFETTQVLLKKGADVNARNADGQTPLHCVSQGSDDLLDDNPRVAQLILEWGADVNAQDKDQATPLHLASHLSKFESARVLLGRGANIHAKNVHGQTPLHMISQGVPGFRGDKSTGLVQLLLDQGADVNARDKDLATPLLLASFQSRTPTADDFLKNGADTNAVNIHGQNALHLISQNPSMYYRPTLPLVNLLLEQSVDINGRDKEKRTPLHLACYYGHFDIANALLDHGAQVDAEDIWGYTPLHQVPLGNRDRQSFGMVGWHQKDYPRRFLEIAKRLLECGADVNAQNKDHETPLHLASRLRMCEMARFLLENGADVNMKNSEGKSPLQLATRRKGKAMRRLLLEYSAKQA